MPALTITAVNSATDRLTIAGHGLVTGAGPAAVYSAGGIVPAGLSGSPAAGFTSYWVIVDDANTVRLASSNANALAGAAIDLTSIGSGALYLLLGLPFRRPRTYGPGSQIVSADLNATFDAMIARLAGFRTLLIPGPSALPAGSAPLATAQNIGFATFSNNTQIFMSITGLVAGERIVAARWRMQTTAGTTFQLKYFDLANSGGITGQTSAGAGASETLSVSPINSAPAAMDSPSLQLLRASGTAVTISSLTCEVDVDRLTI